jgi:hypothetical protein
MQKNLRQNAGFFIGLCRTRLIYDKELASIFYNLANKDGKEPYDWCVLRLYGLLCKYAALWGITYKRTFAVETSILFF